jgi:hypothetical protein
MSDIYLFLDESGEWNFNARGSEYLVFTCLSTQNPMSISSALEKLKYSLLTEGWDIPYFHATEDKQYVRDKVYSILKQEALDFKIDWVYFRKPNTNPILYADKFEPKMYLKVYNILLQYIFRRHIIKDVVIFTDEIPYKKWRGAVEKGLKQSIRSNLGKEIVFRVLHHASKTNFCLQAADYCSWALYRYLGDWGNVEKRPYEEIQHKMASNFDLFGFSDGTEYYRR